MVRKTKLSNKSETATGVAVSTSAIKEGALRRILESACEKNKGCLGPTQMGLGAHEPRFDRAQSLREKIGTTVLQHSSSCSPMPTRYSRVRKITVAPKRR
jgi:hypothetical protein